MKRYLFIVLIAVLAAGQLSAQRFFPGSVGLRVSGGFANDFWQTGEKTDYYAHIGLDKYTKSQNKWVYGVEYVSLNSFYKEVTIPTSIFTGEIGFYKHLLSSRVQSFHLYLGGSLFAGYETINWGKKSLPDGSLISNEDNFIYGGALTLEIEYFFWDKGILFVDLRERVKANSSCETFDFLLGLGFKYIF